MRILCCPFRSPLRASSLFLGGTFKSFNVVAALTIASFRRAALSKLTNFDTCAPLKRASVALFLKVLIIWSTDKLTYILYIDKRYIATTEAQRHSQKIGSMARFPHSRMSEGNCPFLHKVEMETNSSPYIWRFISSNPTTSASSR